MKVIALLAILLLSASSIKFNWLTPHQEAKATVLSLYYCGFGDKFCGQSTEDDVNPGAKLVILAFVNTQSDGSVIMD
jgi:hypothetical protein